MDNGEEKKETKQCSLRAMCRPMNYSSTTACTVSRYMKSNDQV